MSEITCIDCSATFVLTQGEIDFYVSKGFFLPKRCADCRRKRKAQQESEVKYGFR